MAKSQALGRGLGALLSEMEEVYDTEVPKQHTIVEIPLNHIRPNPFQPRKSFDEKSLAELGDSIKEHGLLQPIVVIEDIDGYILVAGERRLRASKLAKTKTIKAIVATLDDDKMREHALVENIQRDELNAIDLAHAYDELLKVHELTHEDLSKKIHKSRTHITNTLRLLQLNKKVQKALLDGKISAGHAKVLVGLDDKEQNMMVDSIIGQKLSVRDVESMVKNMKRDANTPLPSKTQKVELDFSQLTKKLENFGANASCKGNKLTIVFENNDEIAAFLDHLQ